MIRVADYVMQRLYQEGCEHIFSVTGRGILYLTDALASHSEIKSVSVHHEQAAAYAAMAYSQMNEKMGACLVSTGCAGTNAVTSVLCAWQDNIPCVFISGQNKLEETVRYTKLPIRTYGQQEADIISIIEPITKYATMITNPDEIAYEIDRAFYLAKTGRKGPVWIDIPLDVQNMRVEPDELKRFIPEKSEKTFSKDDVAFAVEALKQSQRPVVLIGSGIRSAGAVGELNEFLYKSKLPVVYASSATDIVDSEKVLSLGCVGAMAANRAANFAVQNADLVLVLGCRLSSMVAGSDIQKFARGAKIITVDIDPYEHKKYPQRMDKVIIADVKDFILELSKKELFAINDFWIDKCKHWKKNFPKCESQYKGAEEVDLYELAEVMSKHLKDDAICISDAGLEELIIPTSLEFTKNQRCIHPASQGAMGYALPAAIGSYCSGQKQTVVVVGDGSIMMNLQELQTISHNKLPIKILVINNNCYAVIRKRQKDLFRTRTIGTDSDNGVSCPDFEKVADCFGIRYEKILSTLELDKKLSEVLNMDEAVICEVMAKEDQGYIHSSYRKGQGGRFVQPPIEDQSPFLDRELFLSEMIIEPIDQ